MPASYGTTTEQIRSFYPDSLMISGAEPGDEFLQHLNSFSDDNRKDCTENHRRTVFFCQHEEIHRAGLIGRHYGVPGKKWHAVGELAGFSVCLEKFRSYCDFEYG